MAATCERPATSTKPAGGSVESLRARAAALRREADRLVAAEAVDPVFGLIEAHRAAYAAWEPVAATWDEMVIGNPGYATAEAAALEHGRREQEAFLALLTARPTTSAGLWALTAYLPEVMRKVSPDPVTQEQAALDALRQGALRLGLARASEAGKIRPAVRMERDAGLLADLRDLVAIEAEQEAVLSAGSYEDAFEVPAWVRLEGRRKAILARVLTTRARTVGGLKAKGSLLALNSIKHHQQPIEQLAFSIAADLEGMEGGVDSLAHDDAALIQACDGAVRIVDLLNGPLSSLPEDAFNACMAQTEKLIEIAIATPAMTREGMAGKARILKNEWPCNVSARDKLDNGDLLIRSLVWDLAGKEACA